MRVFVTGATEFIGSAVVIKLLNAGHEVMGGGSFEKTAEALATMGVRGYVGSIEDVESLRKGAADAEGAIHTAFFHQITHMSLTTRLRVMLGEVLAVSFRGLLTRPSRRTSVRSRRLAEPLEALTALSS